MISRSFTQSMLDGGIIDFGTAILLTNTGNCDTIGVEKYNPNHDRLGRFSSGSGGGTAAPAAAAQTAAKPADASKPSEAQKPKTHEAPVFKTATAQSFHDAIAAAKESNPVESRWRVDVHSAEEYEEKCDGDKRFVTEKGSCIAVEKTGNIISVCKNWNTENTDRGADLLKFAVDHGGDRLDAFGETLFNFYSKCGFEPVSWCRFDMQYAPEGWKESGCNPEHVVFFKHTGVRNTTSYNDFLKNTPYSNDYDAAQKARDDNMKKGR